MLTINNKVWALLIFSTAVITGSSIYASRQATSPDGKYTARANSEAGTITISGHSEFLPVMHSTYACSSKPTGLAFSPDGHYLATANTESNDVSIYAFEPGKLIFIASYALPFGSSKPVALAFSPDGHYLATAHSMSDTIVIYAFASGILSSGAPYAMPLGSKSPGWLKFSSNGEYLFVAPAQESKDVTVFNVANHGILSLDTSYVESSLEDKIFDRMQASLRTAGMVLVWNGGVLLCLGIARFLHLKEKRA